ncbi:MAG: WXG100 family type VII secretion target [Flaviflexus sp.]|uniref:WXG100 family type VII secretion target n=1 Tax=Flaviflexus sp. TaxID=1969482 RepID=UPI00352CA6FE
MPTPGVIQDEDGAILAIRNFVETARTDLRTENTRVSGQIDGWRGNWIGEGSNSFASFQSAWNTKFTSLMGILDQFEANLGITSSEFDSTDSDSGSGFNTLTSTID